MTSIKTLLSLTCQRAGLHRNIQDVFNEHGVQIMSPAYVSDPQTAKIVSPEDWYTEPALIPKEQ